MSGIIKAHGWVKIGEDGNYFKRSDGVIVKFVFGGTYPFAVYRFGRRYGQTRKHEWMAGKTKSVRTFKTAKGAMDAADKTWPLPPLKSDKTYISINAHTIRKNAVTGSNDAPIRIARSKNDPKPRYANSVEFTGPARLVYDPRRKILACGARLVLEVEGKVKIA